MAKKISLKEVWDDDSGSEMTLTTIAVKDVVSRILKEKFDDETCKAILATVCIRLIYDWSKESKLDFIEESICFIQVLDILIDHLIKKENL